MKNYTISLFTGIAAGVVIYAIGDSGNQRFEIAYGISVAVFLILWLIPYMIRDVLRKEDE